MIRAVNRVSVGAAAWALAAGYAWADPAGPGLWADVSVELENETVVSAQDSELELSDTFATVEGDLGFALDDVSGLRATLILEPVTDPEGDRFFEDVGLYAEEVYLYGAIGALPVTVGKFNPWFDLATDYAPGLYGDDLAGDYELTERLGGAISVPISLPLSGVEVQHDLIVSIFTTDRTPLSHSLLNDRVDGPSDTDFHLSAAAAVTGQSGGTVYNLAARFQAAGASGKDETGVIAGIASEIEIASVDTLLFGEIGHFENFDGGTDRATFATLGSEAMLGPAAFTAALGIRDAPHSSATQLATASVKINLFEGLAAEAGYRFLNDEGIARHSAGILLSYEFKLR